jgi:methionine synthase I (cobalamin-dependent)
VSIARSAAAEAPDGRRVFVLGSAPPLEDCYRPADVPDDAALAREHGEHARALAAAGVDAVAVETVNTLREARAAASAARGAGLAFAASFVCDAAGRLLSGEPLPDAFAALDGYGPLALGVNCVPAPVVDACLPVLLGSGRPAWVKANLGAPRAGGGRTADLTPETFAGRALAWVRAGVAAVGGCCGTTPDHVAALASALGRTR